VRKDLDVRKKGYLTYLTDRSAQQKVTWNISQILQLSKKEAGIPLRYVRSSNKELEYMHGNFDKQITKQQHNYGTEILV
jgi:hypothetical protein